LDASFVPESVRRRGPRGRLITTALFVVTALAACSTAPAATPTIPPTATGSIQPAATATPSPSSAPAFPVTLTDDEGTKVDLAAEPLKIVSLTPATTEILFALGVGDRIVGKVEDFTLYPPEAAAIPDVAKFGEVDVEKIVSLEADLVIAGGNSFNPPDKIAQLRELKVPVLVVYAPDIDTVFTDIELTGAAVGKAEGAKDLTASMRAAFDQVGAATSGLDKPRVFYELDATREIFTAADDSFLANMIELAGGEPITTGSTTNFEIPLETLVTADPEVILLGDAAYGTTAEAVAARPGWNVMTAVKDGSIRPVDDVIITRPGPRLVNGLVALAQAIHPAAVIPGASSSAESPAVSASPSPVSY
jgi:iron complex transport system substrate-binding protein